MGQLALAVKAARESDRLRESARARQDREVKELAVLVEQMYVVQRGRAKVVRDLHNSVVNLRWRLWTVDERLERARAARASGAWPLYSAAVLAEVEAEVEAQVEAQVEVEGDWVEATAPQALQAKVAELETSAAVMKQQLLAAEGRCAAAHAEVVAGAAARQVILAENVRLLAALREVETELARTLPERSLSLQKEIIAADRALRDELFTKKLEKPLMIRSSHQIWRLRWHHVGRWKRAQSRPSSMGCIPGISRAHRSCSGRRSTNDWSIGFMCSLARCRTCGETQQESFGWSLAVSEARRRLLQIHHSVASAILKTPARGV